jgi:activator of 2-hydroxyglutaryl-CoA dehydratase
LTLWCVPPALTITVRRADDLVSRLCEKNGITTKDISYTMATGYSRKILSIADDDISEITAHAYGVRVTAPKEYRPGMIIDIGGQDSKIIYLDSQYSIKNFTKIFTKPLSRTTPITSSLGNI